MILHKNRKNQFPVPYRSAAPGCSGDCSLQTCCDRRICNAQVFVDPGSQMDLRFDDRSVEIRAAGIQQVIFLGEVQIKLRLFRRMAAVICLNSLETDDFQFGNQCIQRIIFQFQLMRMRQHCDTAGAADDPDAEDAYPNSTSVLAKCGRPEVFPWLQRRTSSSVMAAPFFWR